MTNKPNMPPPASLEEWDRRIVALQAELGRARTERELLTVALKKLLHQVPDNSGAARTIRVTFDALAVINDPARK
jgi:hypothetical protein